MSKPLNDETLDVLFLKARTYTAWQDKPVSDDLLRRVYDTMKWAPTSANSNPARFLFLRTRESKERLKPALQPGNIDKTMSAPVVAIFAYDETFYDHLPELFPNNPSARDWFASAPDFSKATAFRNGSLQGGYFILAARALGLDCGPMSGFDNAKVDQEFFGGTTFKSNFLCNLGYGDPSRLFSRNPRISFEQACKLM
jgi:3-hydroxypropanoate dehydrogenase